MYQEPEEEKEASTEQVLAALQLQAEVARHFGVVPTTVPSLQLTVATMLFCFG